MDLTPLLVEEVGTEAALHALAVEWTALAALCGDGLPFRTHEWNDAWWRWFGERRVAVRDSLWMRAFRTRAGELVGVAPLVLVRRPGVGPALLRGLEFVGADPYVTELRGPLVHPAHEVEVYRALLAHLRERADDWDYIRWRGVPAGGDGERVLAGAGGVELPRESSAYRLPVEGTFEQFRASRPRNLKEALRKCYNSLARDGHAFELEVARSPAEVERALGSFLPLHAARAAADGLPRHGDVFRDPASRAFLLDVCGRLAARDAVRVFLLRIRGEVVASRVAFALDGTLYLYFSGYDPEWAPYSVMTTTVAEAVRYAFANGFSYVHLSTGTDPSKTRWRPERLGYREGVQYASAARGRGVRWLADRVSGVELNGRVERLARGVLGRRRAT